MIDINCPYCGHTIDKHYLTADFDAGYCDKCSCRAIDAEPMIREIAARAFDEGWRCQGHLPDDNPYRESE